MTTVNNVEYTHLIQSIIESSSELQRKMMKYLKNLNVEVPHLALLRDLFHSFNPNLLFDLDKTTYLIDMLNRHAERSYNFYATWFECFLCDEHYVQTAQESQQFLQLLNNWTNKFQYDHDLLEKISMKLDTLLDKLTNVVKSGTRDQRLIYFIKQMTDVYFRQSKKRLY